MNILLLGATGFIGSAVAARLRADGHEVIGVTRALNVAARRVPVSEWIKIDIARATKPETWLAHLKAIDAVVNCAGVLQDSPSESTRGVHVAGVEALFAACERAGVRRVIHFSAIGVDRETPTAFSRTKREGDDALMARDLDWVILRPSVVVGRGAFGGSALFRGLAATPGFVPTIPDAAPLQIVQLDDITATVAFFLRPEAPARQVLELAGPERLTFADVVSAYRRWLGWGKAPVAPLPRWMAAVLFRLGDFVRMLGWRPPVSSTAQREMVRGAVGDPARWTELTGIAPRSLSAALAAEPASVQERWFAQLYLLKPLAFGVFALFWIATGLISLGPGYTIGESLMREGEVEPLLGTVFIVGGAVSDILIGIALLFRRTAKAGLIAALIISIVYVVLGTYLVPRLWSDPLGPMMKIWPVLAFNLLLLAIVEER